MYLKKGSILTVHIKNKKFLYICKMDISKMSNFKNSIDFFVKKTAILKLKHDVGNYSIPYKYFCDHQFFELKKVNRTFLDIF